jgi:hypothetical protein
LQAKDESELLSIADRLEMRDINFTMFHEPDFETGYTSIAAGPIYGSSRNFFKKFKFFR